MSDAELRRLGTRANSTDGGIVVVGAGLAGLFTALKLAPLPVTVVSSAPFGEGGSSFWAQAGIAAAVGEGDSPEAHAQDTVAAGAGIVEESIAELMAREARSRVAELLEYGVPFDRDLEGKLALGQEAAHTSRRILHVKGDTAGKAIMSALIEAVRKTPSITVMDGWNAGDLLLSDGRVAGIALHSVDQERPKRRILPARAVILATGGAGQLYAVTTNPAPSRGEGVAIAARAGAVIADAEFVQFHPTALNIGVDPAPLATEALRGEGAHLIDNSGKRFMRGVHPDAELAPRDIVARAVDRQVVTGAGAYLDLRPFGPTLAQRFPTVHAACLAAGIDPAVEPVPVAPAAHYHMGGVLTDADGRSSVDGLWACGEVASTGAHGANRLASNSLLEAVVFGARVAEDVAATMQNFRGDAGKAFDFDEPPAKDDTRRIRLLRQTMAAKAGVVRDEKSLAEALAVIAEVEASRPDRPLKNMLTAAKLIAAAAYARHESRGAHFRSDYPEANPALAKRSFFTLEEAEAIAREAAGGNQTRSGVVTALHA
jgi:L-aspartate oxidase